MTQLPPDAKVEKKSGAETDTNAVLNDDVKYEETASAQTNTTADMKVDVKAGTRSGARKPSAAQFVARVGLMATLALVFSYVEAIIPYNPGIPGIKLGIANAVTVIALYKYSWKDAACVSVIRIILAGLLFNGMFGMLYSMAGAAVSFAGMLILKKTRLFSVIGVSMAAGVLHNLGQLLVAAALIEDLRIFFYFPVLMFSGIAAGILVGIISTIILKNLKVATV